MSNNLMKLLNGKRGYKKIRKIMKQKHIEFVLVLDDLPVQLENCVYDHIEKYMQEHHIKTLMVVADKARKSVINKSIRLENIYKLFIGKENMEYLIRYLSAKVTAMGDLIYKDFYVVSATFPTYKEIDYLLEKNIFSKEHIVWHRLFHVQNIYASDN